MQISSTSSLRRPVLPTDRPRSIRTAAKGKSKKAYGTGRQQQQADDSGLEAAAAAAAAAEAPEPTLKDYLEFGSAMGEGAEAVQARLDARRLEVVVDQESKDYLAAQKAWSVDSAYAMLQGTLGAPKQSSKLAKNKGLAGYGMPPKAARQAAVEVAAASSPVQQQAPAAARPSLAQKPSRAATPEQASVPEIPEPPQPVQLTPKPAGRTEPQAAQAAAASSLPLAPVPLHTKPAGRAQPVAPASPAPPPPLPPLTLTAKPGRSEQQVQEAEAAHEAAHAAVEARALAEQEELSRRASARQRTAAAAAAQLKHGRLPSAPEEVKKVHRDANYKLSKEALEQGRIFTLKVWKVNGAGVFASLRHDIAGFIPFTLLSIQHVQQVLHREAQLLEELGEGASAQEKRELRSKAMEVLLGALVTVKVHSMSNDPTDVKIILSERAAQAAQGSEEKPILSAAQLDAAEALLGQEVQALVLHVMNRGALVEFECGAEGAVVGMISARELSWEAVKPHDCVKQGQLLRASVCRVDRERGRVSLSKRALEPSPLREALDDNMLIKANDLRRAEGDLPEAVAFCAALHGAPGIVEVATGIRARGRAVAPQLQVFMHRAMADDGLNLTMADNVEGWEEGSSVPMSQGNLTVNFLVLRLGQDVQQIIVTTDLDRHSLRTLVADTVAALKRRVPAA